MIATRKLMRGRGLAGVIALVLFAPALPGGAQAGPAECAGIAGAFAALTEIPGFAQTLEIEGQPPALLMVLGNSLYLKGASGWKAKPLPPQRRTGLLLPDYSESAIDACEARGTEDEAGTMVRHYGFTLRGEKGERRVRLSIGLQDGLIRALSAPGLNLRLRYDGLMAPIP